MVLPGLALAYLWATIAAACALLAFGAAGAAPWPTWDLLAPDPASRLRVGLLFTLAVLAAQFPLPIRPNRKVTVAPAVQFAMLLLLDFPSTAVLAGASQLIGLFIRTGREPDRASRGWVRLRSLAFNTSQVILAFGLGRLAFELLEPGRAGPLGRLESLWAVPTAAVVVYAINTLLVAGMISLQKRRRLADVWLPGRAEDSVQYAGLYATGLAAALAAERYPWALLVLLLPALLIYLSLKRTVELARQTETALEAMQQLQEQREELARRIAEASALHELDRAKNELITTISHELRTPITVIHGYAQLLKSRRGVVEPQKLETLAQAVYANSTQLQRLVQDLVDVGRVERGTFTLESEPFDLASLIEEVVAGAQTRPGGERIILERTGELPVFADRARVVQVLSNLLENAIKYAPQGPILVRSRAAADAIRVEVEDRGPGVPPDERQRVWEKFFRGSDVVRHNLQRGTGIGLSLVKALVEAQSGRVGLDSPAAGGSLFWFELPTPRALTPATPLPTQASPLTAA